MFFAEQTGREINRLFIDDCIANDRFAKPFCFAARPLRWSASIIGYARLNRKTGKQKLWTKRKSLDS
jgi:hypothetical protein